MKNIAVFVTEGGHKIIRAVKQVSDDYSPADNELVLVDEVFDLITDDDGKLVKPYRVAVDKTLLDELTDIDEYLFGTVESEKLFVASYHLEDDKKWLNDIKQVSQSEIDYDLFVLLDSPTYYFLNSIGVDLGLNVFYVDPSVTRVTLADLKKASIVTASELSVSDALAMLIKSYQSEARKLLDSRLDAEAVVVMTKFALLNNQLAQHGYFITDSNRQEQYTHIVESGDKQLLQTFSEYLEVYHKVLVGVAQYDAYIKFVADSNDADNKDKLESLWYEYLQHNFS